MLGFELSPVGQTGQPRGILPLADFFRPNGGTSVAIAAGLNGGLSLWSEVGPRHAACLLLDNTDPATRLSWRETLIAELRNVYPIGAFTLTGSWSQLQSSGSGLGGSYTGNRAVSTSATTATAEVTVSRAATYDLWVHFTGRTSGGYMRVDIDGAQTLVNEIDTPAGLGFKAFTTYTPTDLQRRQTIKVASGLTGTHTVALRLGGAAVPGGNAIIPEAVSTSATLADPHILPPLWQPGTTYEMGDEVQFGGTFYAARGNGPSGTLGPLHTSGIATDGALDWRADFRPTYPEFVAIDYASEREYALRFAVAAADSEVGGQTHGNERLDARTILLDGAPWSAKTTGNGLSLGQTLAIVEETTWQTQAGSDVADCRLTRQVMPAGINHDVRVTMTGPQADLEWFYAGMLPLVHWDAESGTTVFDQLDAPETTQVNFTDYTGTNPPNIPFDGQTRLGASGSVLGQPIRYGFAAGSIATTGNALAAFSSFLRPNLDGRTASGSLDWTAKAYVAANLDGGVALQSGDALAFFNRHVIAVGP